MQAQTIKSVLVHKYGQTPEFKEKPMPELKAGEVLIKVDASTINPSDRIFIAGHYFNRPLPAGAGLEGVGHITKVQSADQEHLVGKRVSFVTQTGSWSEYATSSLYFVIDEDVSLSSAASGIINPLTVLGFLWQVRTKGHSGIIHTAAASALGRQLNKICIRNKIPLLNVVRRKEQAELLRSEGAEHVLVTEGDWQQQYKEFLGKAKFDAFFDALGGGEVTRQLIDGLSLPATVYIYGMLTGEPLVFNTASKFFSGLTVTGFYMSTFWASCSNEDREKIRNEYSVHLKGDLATTTVAEFNFSQIKDALDASVKRATEGKVLLKF